jgi:hypothetical protein
VGIAADLAPLDYQEHRTMTTQQLQPGLLVEVDRGIGMIIEWYGGYFRIRLLAGETIIRSAIIRVIGCTPRGDT